MTADAPAQPAATPAPWIAWAGAALRLTLRALAATWRVRIDGPAPRGAEILALWHGDMLPWILPLAARPASVMVSPSRDGDLLCAALAPLGYGLPRGSSSRGGRPALDALAASLARGEGAILAVDGPRGPRHHAHGGAARLARATGQPLVALGVAVTGGLRLGSWDGLLIPWPFARVALTRVEVAPGPPDGADGPRLGAALRRARQEAVARLRAGALAGPRWGILWAATALTGLVLLPAAALGLALRPRWREQLGERRGASPGVAPSGAVVRFVAASLGEARVARALAQRLRPRLPAGAVLQLHTQTPEARAVEAATGAWDACALAPLPVPLGRAPAAPAAAVWVESELWPDALRRAALGGAAVFVVNARISERSARRLGWARAWLGPALAGARVQARTPGDAARLRRLGARPSLPEADLKALVPPGAPAPALTGWAGGAPLWVAGCVHPGEEATVLEAHARARTRVPGLRLLLAPRSTEHAPSWRDLARARGLDAALRSELGRDPAAVRAEILVLDTLGELAGAYALAQAALVGQTLVPGPGHDPLEPARAGARVLLGPFGDAIGHLALALERAGRAERVSDAHTLADAVARACAAPRPETPWRDEAAEVAADAVVDAIAAAVAARGAP